MAANRDEALKCIAISQKHFNAGNYPSARRFAEKSISLFPTPEAKQLLEIISIKEDEDESSAGPSTGVPNGNKAKASGAEAHETSGTTHSRHHASSSSTSNGSAGPSSEKKREFTPDMAAVVSRIRKCKVTEYYEILGLEKSCEEADVKRAYRKLALQLHPDKNGAPGADEAFKMVSKAFQILSDDQKRAAFDQHGDDPDSRFAGVPAAQAFGPGGATFQGELSPEELFNMFFGGGGLQQGFGPAGFGAFGGGPVFTTTFGPGGFRTTRMGGMPRRREGNQANANRNLLQLLPVIFIFLFPLLSSLLSMIFGTSPTPDPPYSLYQTTQFNTPRLTTPHKVPYYVNLPSFQSHPIYESIPVNLREEAQVGQKAKSKTLKDFESKVEDKFASFYYTKCQREHQRKEQELEQARGFFGFGADPERIKKISESKLESCEVLKQHGFLS